jgi:predicted GNAT family acetyltransferase
MLCFSKYLTESDQQIVQDINTYRERVLHQHGVILDAYYQRGNAIHVGKIVVPKDRRGMGLGATVMAGLHEIADRNKLRVVLSPSTDFGGTSVSRLKAFYKSLGYVENKGRYKDFTISDSMYREPQ